MSNSFTVVVGREVEVEGGEGRHVMPPFPSFFRSLRPLVSSSRVCVSVCLSISTMYHVSQARAGAGAGESRGGT